MKKYNVGLLIGRFQPLHKGHLHLIKRSLHYVDKLIVALGSANRSDEQNPLTLSVRKKMVEDLIIKEKLKKKITKIVSIDDYLEDDSMWLKKALVRAGKFDVLIGNDEWTDSIFEKAGFKVLRLGFYKRNLFEGTKIRKLQKEKKDWKSRIPIYLIKHLS